MKAKPRFKDRRIQRLLYDDTQAPRASTNTSGINVSWGVCQKDNIDDVKDIKTALKGKECRYE